LISKFFTNSMLMRICGPLFGALIFFIISNFGVWIQGVYGYSVEGLIACYVLAIPFFQYTVISTIIFSFIIEVACRLLTIRVFKTEKQ
jgi:hypothetical protein